MNTTTYTLKKADDPHAANDSYDMKRVIEGTLEQVAKAFINEIKACRWKGTFQVLVDGDQIAWGTVDRENCDYESAYWRNIDLDKNIGELEGGKPRYGYHTVTPDAYQKILKTEGWSLIDV